MIDAEMIKADLLSLDTRDFYIKYIVKSKYWYFSDYLEVPGDEVIDVLAVSYTHLRAHET